MIFLYLSIFLEQFQTFIEILEIPAKISPHDT